MSHPAAATLVKTLLEDSAREKSVRAVALLVARSSASPAELTRCADAVYDEVYTANPGWWDNYHQLDVDPDAESVAVFDRFCDAYPVDPDSELAALVFEHIYAGMT